MKKQLYGYLRAASKAMLIFISGMAILFVLLSFTDIPYFAYYALGSPESTLTNSPDIIVIMGGAGMPSPDGLIRCYYGAAAAKLYDTANIIIAFPGSISDTLDQLQLMAKELIIRGVDSARIAYEPNGYNTYSQAMNIRDMHANLKKLPGILIITTPEHMFRTVRVFRKAGFSRVGGSSAFEKPVDPEKLKRKRKDKNIKLAFRYNTWSYMQYEIKVMREYLAIAVYKLRGWI